MAKAIFPVQGMTCEGCVSSVQEALTSRAGVVSARASLEENHVEVEYDPAVIETASLKNAIEDAGFDVPG